MKSSDLNGLIPATLTPMTADFEVDEAGLRKYARWMLGHDGLKAVAINMDTGEGPHLTAAEKRRIVSIWKEEAGAVTPILAGVGGPSTAAAVAEARDAEQAGVDGLVIFPIPAYAGQPLPPDVPLKHHEAIAKAANLPIVLFQLQASLGGVIFDSETLTRLLEIENVVAIKEASFDTITFERTAELVARSPRDITLLTGNDNFILESFMLGASGALIGFGTIAVAEQIEMIQCARTTDFSRALKIYRETVRPLANAMFAPPVRNYRARLKEGLACMGILEQCVMRPPLLPLDATEREAVRASLERVGML